MFETLSTWYFILKIFVIAFDAVLVAVTFWVISKAMEVRPNIVGVANTAGQTAATRRTRVVAEAWAAIESQAQRGLDGKRLGVIDADRLVDKLLKEAGYEGEGALDRMRQLPLDRLATAGDLMAAHRFRNRLVHEVGFAPGNRELDSALAQYQAFLTEVGYLN